MNRKFRSRYGSCHLTREPNARDPLVWSSVESPPFPKRIFTEIIPFPFPTRPGPPPTERRPLAA